ncbi:MAG: UDP-2,4-diacetamido-2,4,6-trideoxy-beta-L-altropyranose hydrolase [Lachnospiraceae bacterium]|nr:UDP-2,4-diacetamido-2,4,6-trideoxy-beta-L-altropyranose hydrolase [Lachnospiraceae bacterium]
MILFRVDGNAEIATGHLMRCLSIARTAIQEKVAVHFLVSDEDSAALLNSFLLEGEDFPLTILHTDYQKLDSEIPVLLEAIRKAAGLLPETYLRREPIILLLDTYQVTHYYLNTLENSIRTAYLDDLMAFDYPVDYLINYDLNVNTAFYRKAAHLLCGPEYTPLRRQFQNVSYTFKDPVENIFLSTGGTDNCHVTLQLLKAVFVENNRNFTQYQYHILLGSMNPDRAEILAMAKQYSGIILHENVNDMAALMSSCDLAVSAAGTTLFELCALGVPAISYIFADNQLPSAKAFMDAGAIPYAGDARKPDLFYPQLLACVSEMISNTEFRKIHAQKEHLLIDGQGARRIVNAFSFLFHNDISE